MTKEAILRKHGKIDSNTGSFNFKFHTLVTTKQAMSAMDEYATQLKEENKRLQTFIGCAMDDMVLGNVKEAYNILCEALSKQKGE